MKNGLNGPDVQQPVVKEPKLEPEDVLAPINARMEKILLMPVTLLKTNVLVTQQIHHVNVTMDPTDPLLTAKLATVTNEDLRA